MSDRLTKYTVVVSNIGTVYRGANKRTAEGVYSGYKAQSKAGTGRAGNESVTLFVDGEIYLHHEGDHDE